MKLVASFVVAGTLSLASVFAFAADSWDGAYVGAQGGINSTSANAGISSESALNLGLLGGYNVQMSDGFVLGADVFYEWNAKKTHEFPGFGSAKIGSEAYGADVMAGFPFGENGAWMPFAKLGYGWADFTGSGSSGVSTQNATRYGVGIAWRLDQMFDLNFQYMYQKFGGETSDWKNQNYTVGVTYHFR